MNLAQNTPIDLPGPLVSAAWLADHMHQPGLKIIDATFRMPGATPAAPEVYALAHLPGAVFFDIDEIADHTTDLPHMLPDAAGFEQAMADLGIGAGDRIVIYDTAGILGAARVWWMLRVFGHDNAAILDGGREAWRAEGRPVTPEVAVPVAATPFVARFRPELVHNLDQMMAMVNAGRSQHILDARSAARFSGAAEEPRPGLRAGHIPGSRNLDHALLIDPANGKLKPAREIGALLKASGIAVDEPVVTSCGSGVSACVLAFCLYLLGKDDVAVYDGSWSEWGIPGRTPVETGA
ncbi:MAG TPA: 3-mercaptopyruvate sulfurtransferase [Stellaceae bacterium]|jgi:thiosulfate/3-mercaptopyruvate sulfurtransferase|nr:3-mercaptopyruvate sulfurtransferase [Stellaceae bacterium]